MDNYIDVLRTSFEDNRDNENAPQMKKYMRDKFEFLGIKSVKRRELSKSFIRESKDFNEEKLKKIVYSLWNLDEREYQYIAIDIMRRHAKRLEEDGIKLLEDMIVNKSWWDTVDMIATNLVGDFFKSHPKLIIPYTTKWINSDNIWLQRTAILFQLKYKEKTNSKLLFKYIKHLLGSNEFFINKGIGWALREYSKTEPKLVIDFVNNNQLSTLSTREALKVINKQDD